MSMSLSTKNLTLMGMAMKAKLNNFLCDLIAYIAVGGTMAIMVICLLTPQ